MNGWETLAAGGGGLLLTIALTGRYLLNRLKALETESRERQAAALKTSEADRARLQTEVETLRFRVTESEKRESTARLETEANRRDLDELRASFQTAMIEIAALREQVTKLETELDTERTEKQRLESRNTAQADKIKILEGEKVRLEIQYATLLDVIRDRLDASAGQAHAKADEASAPSGDQHTADPQPAGEG